MRLKTMVIFGAGYLVGTRAGRDRYKQIAESARGFAESDVVQSYMDRAVELVKRPLVSVIPDSTKAATDATGKVTTGGEAVDSTTAERPTTAGADGN
jgi:hypothetical protein